MPENLEQLIERAAQVIIELRALIAQGHAMQKSLTQQEKRIDEKLKISLDETIAPQVQLGLDEFKNSLDTAIKAAEKAVFQRFDNLAALLFEDDGKETLEELAMKKVAKDQMLEEIITGQIKVKKMGVRKRASEP